VANTFGDEALLSVVEHHASSLQHLSLSACKGITWSGVAGLKVCADLATSCPPLGGGAHPVIERYWGEALRSSLCSICHCQFAMVSVGVECQGWRYVSNIPGGGSLKGG
jgi:hypothetical protein